MTNGRPRVCLISEDLSLPIDEGIKKFVTSVARALSEETDTLILSTESTGPLPPGVHAVPANRVLLSRALRDAIQSHRPEAIIYVPQAAATCNSFVRCGVLRRYAPEARITLVSLQPRIYGSIARRLIPLLHPDLTLAQSQATSDRLRALGCPSAVLPSGVDLDSFCPATADQKSTLRQKYGLDADAFVVLHVGHLKRERNVLLLNRIRTQLHCETVVVGSTSTHTGIERDVVDALRRAGTHVIDSYIEHIAEMYQLADCYLFPVQSPTAAIEMPLSVLEALGCGVPVVTTRFGPLPGWFTQDTGFRFADSDDALVAAVASIQNAGLRAPESALRAQVERFSWPSITRQLLDFTFPLRSTGHAGEREEVTTCAY